MTAIAVCHKPWPDEDLNKYKKRRMYEAACYIRSFSQRWSQVWARPLASFTAHAQRSHAPSWVTDLLNYRCKAWLQKRRADVGSHSIYGGKTRTRVFGGIVYARCDESLDVTLLAYPKYRKLLDDPSPKPSRKPRPNFVIVD